MRKLAVFLTVIVCVIGIAGCAWGGVAVNAVNFPDPVFLEFVKMALDTGWTVYDSNGAPYTVGADDGILGEKEIEALTDFEYKGITSMKGIEYFTALTKLYCVGFQLTELDVSKNTALTTLLGGWNQLTELDLSNNTALTYLDCAANSLGTLDVSRNTALTELYCGGNHLTELDLSNNTALTHLSCGSNQLTSLDVSRNTALTELYCDGQKRSGLKVKKTSEGYYEIDMKDYVSKLENIDADSFYGNNRKLKPLSYDKKTGIVTFSDQVTVFHYDYIIHPKYDNPQVR